jgi:predicted nucleotidyltransferase
MLWLQAQIRLAGPIWGQSPSVIGRFVRNHSRFCQQTHGLSLRSAGSTIHRCGRWSKPGSECTAGRYHDVVSLDGLRRFRREILEVAARHGARNVRVFGSIARGDDRPGSDVDFLVDVERGRTLLDVIALEQDLEQLLGRNVSVLTDGGLSPYLQRRILAEASAL